MRDPRNSLRQWLDAETSGDDATAERALGEAFRALPRPLLPAGFAARVMQKVAEQQAAWPLERAALWLLVTCAAALACVPLWLPGLWARVEPAAWIARGAELVVLLARGLATLAPVWEALLRVGHWTALALTAPPALLFVAFCGLLAASAARLLVSLLEERSSAHAQVS